MFRFLKRLIAKNLKSNEFTGDIGEYDVILEKSFSNKVATQLYNQLVINIITNNFNVDIPDILDEFSEHKFKLDEFLILAFKMGMLSQTFIHKPELLLQQGLKMNSVFNKRDMKNLDMALQEALQTKDSNIRTAYQDLEARIHGNKKEIDPDTVANKQIEAWLAKKNKSKTK